MKTPKKLIAVVCMIICLYSCKDSVVNPISSNAGAINVTNAVIGGATITFSTNNSIISSNNTIGSNAAAFLPISAGNTQVNLGVPAVAATVTTAAIPAVTYYTNTLTVNSSSNYSLFLTGTSPSAVDNVLIQESYPRAYADSVCGVRFINLAPGSNPISIDIKGNANGSEVASLAYKAYSGFNQHPAIKTTPSYVFEFRDATSGNLITSYTLTPPYFHNVTLCLRGIVGGTTGVILDADY